MSHQLGHGAIAQHWPRLPAELRALKQWVIAGHCDACAQQAPKRCGAGDCLHKAPLTLAAPGAYPAQGAPLRKAKSTDPNTWLDFPTAAQAAYERGLHIGFVLHESDPYCVIDLDVKDATNEVDPNKWTTQQQFDRFWSIVQHFDSYTETSRSGKGLHIWVRGAIGQGVKRDGVEVYSQERYIISTGQVVIDKPILDRQEMVLNMSSQMRGPALGKMADLVELEEEDSDDEVFERAMTATNGAKFNELCAGRWEQFGFPSQSEADLALMSIFTFYSKSNEQCRRLFRCTALGKREKAQKNNKYLNFTLQLIRGRQAADSAAQASGEQLAMQLIASVNAKAQYNQPAQMHVPGPVEVRVPIAPSVVTAALAGPTPAPVVAVANDGLPWPPGLAGGIAGFIFQSAPRPVKEVAIVGALGLLAGICGKSYHIPQSGLNMYIILVARSAVGKEAMHSGISALLRAASMRSPAIMQCVDFSDFASGPALVKACAKTQSFVNVAGEFGRKLKRIASDDGREGPMSSLRTVMTNLYQKSGPQSLVGGMQYSNNEKNVATVSGVAFSLIGESTPGTFYDALTEAMMEDGFLSRFTVIEYDGPRPPLNPAPVLVPNQALGDAVANLAQTAMAFLGQNRNIEVTRTNPAAEMLSEFEQECDREINSTTDESWRQMWNRASLKAMRISALLAVADNCTDPVVQPHYVDWALQVVRRDIAIMARRLESGDVGTGDNSRERKILAAISEYLEGAGAQGGYAIPASMVQQAIVPRKFLQIRVARVNAFANHRLGANAALDMTLKSMSDSGYIQEVPKEKLVAEHLFHGKAYRILQLPDYASDRKRIRG